MVAGVSGKQSRSELQARAAATRLACTGVPVSSRSHLRGMSWIAARVLLPVLFMRCASSMMTASQVML